MFYYIKTNSNYENFLKTRAILFDYFPFDIIRIDFLKKTVISIVSAIDIHKIFPFLFNDYKVWKDKNQIHAWHLSFDESKKSLEEIKNLAKSVSLLYNYSNEKKKYNYFENEAFNTIFRSHMAINDNDKVTTFINESEQKQVVTNTAESFSNITVNEKILENSIYPLSEAKDYFVGSNTDKNEKDIKELLASNKELNLELTETKKNLDKLEKFIANNKLSLDHNANTKRWVIENEEIEQNNVHKDFVKIYPKFLKDFKTELGPNHRLRLEIILFDEGIKKDVSKSAEGP